MHIAESRGFSEIAELLRKTLEEEQATDTKLNSLAKQRINPKAAQNYDPA